jgi:DNA-binding NtrC family response regulator
LARWIHLRATRQTPAGLTAPCIVNLAECEGPEAFAGLKDSASGPRWFLIAEGSREELRHHPAVPASLAAALDPLPIVVPPLRERRVEIPALVSVLARNVARRLGLPALALSDEAMASLWRQRWNENVRELKAVVRHLTLAYPGREVVGVEVLTVLRARGLEALERLPTRRATRLDIEQALESTRHGSGSWNLSRAARYLGWDPATLSSRLRGREKK